MKRGTVTAIVGPTGEGMFAESTKETLFPY
jgi:hypothetical protein